MISIIVVVGKNREIGCDNKLLWNLPEDMQRFKKITMGKTVVMGDKTFESIGGTLPRRKNIVVSLKEGYQAPGCETRDSLEEVLEEYKSKDEELFVIGGGMIYELALSHADKLYITEVDDAPKADTHFPDYSEFKKIVYEKESFDGTLNYKFLELIK
ncbi:MAG: dihydrofolate reductase [Patescibacteria group bacterium]|nr:dihydrofolate reductase [Patescibacteria group bacterium]